MAEWRMGAAAALEDRREGRRQHGSQPAADSDGASGEAVA